MRRIVCGVAVLCLIPFTATHAQTQQSINDLKGKIFDAKMLQQTFVNGLKFCNVLNGTNFYFPPRNRVLDLEEYHRSLESLAQQRVFNPERHRPWTEEDAAERWTLVQRQATKDAENCKLVASLPDLEKQLDDMEKKAAAAEPKN